MLRTCSAVIAALCLCCGGADSPDATVEHENRPPHIDTASLLPRAPTASDSLSVAVRVQDPDRDEVGLEVAWYRNGGFHQKGVAQSLKPFSFAKGDRIHVVVHASDGVDSVSRSSEAVLIGNTAPQIISLDLSPETALADDVIRANVGASDIDGDEIEYRYRWYVDDSRIDSQGAQLPPRTATRADRVSVEVAGFDGTDLGRWVRSDALLIGNSAPSITTQPTYTLNADGLYQYAVNAVDADGDQPLTYELLEAPSGMRVGVTSGIVAWEVPRDANGSFQIELSVSDPHGARTLQRYSLDLSWETRPAAAQ